MQTLGVVGMEDGALIATSDLGERFRIPVDAAVRALLRAEPAPADTRRLSPREIQAHVRAGLTAQQVAALTGAAIGYVERFVGPVLAERRYVVDSALATRLAPADDGAPRTFGAVMTERFEALDAQNVTWSSAKEASGWVVGVAFTADGIAHDARWRFDPKRQQLAPENVEAATLSQDGTPAALTPRLRAIEPTTPVTLPPVTPPRTALGPVRPAPVARSRFDSAAFDLPDLAPKRTGAPVPAAPATAVPGTGMPTRAAVAVDPAPTQAMPIVRGAHLAPAAPTATATATATAGPSAVPTAGPSAGPSAVAADRVQAAARPAPVTRGRFPVPAAVPETTPEPEPAPQRPAPARAAVPQRRGRSRPERRGREDGGAPTKPVTLPTRGRSGRSSMPSWDEIVFGRDED